MSTIPDTLRYKDSHEWIELSEGARAVGISDHAQDELTEIVYVELPEVGREVEAGEACAVVESVKAASDIYSPVSGTITEVNNALDDEPGLINTAAHSNGWIFKIDPSDPSQIDAMLDAEAYGALIG